MCHVVFRRIGMKLYTYLLAIFLLVTFTGCSPEVGSDAWCEDMKAKPKRDWSASEAADYTKHCIFK